MQYPDSKEFGQTNYNNKNNNIELFDEYFFSFPKKKVVDRNNKTIHERGILAAMPKLNQRIYSSICVCVCSNKPIPLAVCLYTRSEHRKKW